MTTFKVKKIILAIESIIYSYKHISYHLQNNYQVIDHTSADS